MKRIGFLIMNFANGGGTERVTSVIANELVNNGYEIDIISCRDGEKNRFHINERIGIFSLHGEKYKNVIYRKIVVLRELNMLVKERRIDILVAVDIPLYMYLLPLQTLKKCKCIAWEHFNYYSKTGLIAKFSRYLATRYADCVIVLGNNDLKNYRNNCKKIKRIEYIYNPLTISKTGQANMSNKSIIAVGRLEHQKGYDYLLKIWENIEKRFPDWKLNIYGEGSQKQYIEKYIEENKLNNIYLNGYVSDISEALKKASIFVLTSRYEGFGLVLSEAQLLGLPCISFDCKEGPSEIIDDGVNGYLIPTFDIDEFIEKLSTLICDESLRNFFSKNCQKDLYKFEIKAIIEKWKELLESI